MNTLHNIIDIYFFLLVYRWIKSYFPSEVDLEVFEFSIEYPLLSGKMIYILLIK